MKEMPVSGGSFKLHLVKHNDNKGDAISTWLYFINGGFERKGAQTQTFVLKASEKVEDFDSIKNEETTYMIFDCND
ncbi:MAG: hypothetical protein HUJ51_05055 [Eggerthellaceae bacterium]|nr:hypothetical protein [Eggerthellaceae bacterium]